MFISDILSASIKPNLQSIEKSINKILGEIKSFNPKTSPQKIEDFFQKVVEQADKSLGQNSTKNIKDLQNILNELKDLDFYKSDPKALNNLKEKLSTLIKNQPSTSSLTTSHKKILRNLYHKAATLIEPKKENPKIKEFIQNIKTILEDDLAQKDISPKLKDLQNSFNKLKESLLDSTNLKSSISNPIGSKESLSNIVNIKETLKTMQQEISSLFSSSPKIKKEYKEFGTLIKDTISNIKTGKIKLLNQRQMIKNIGNITKNIDIVLTRLPNDKKFEPIKEELSKFVKNINEIDLKANIKNSGTIYESKIAQQIDDKTLSSQVAKNDAKGILLSLKSDANILKNPTLQNAIDNALSQINAIQANALLGQNFASYIPFAWESLKDGHFTISKLKKEDGFSCKIELDLENYDKVDILMLFHKELLSIKIDTENQEFKNLLQKEYINLQNSLDKLGFQTTIFFAKKQQKGYLAGENFNNTLDMDIKA